MNLKEAFRFQKTLKTTAQALSHYLYYGKGAVKEVWLHKKSELGEAFADEEKVMERPDVPETDKIILAMLAVVNERAKLTAEINKAKRRLIIDSGIDIDELIQKNKVAYDAVASLRELMGKKRDGEVEMTGTLRTFNAEGNQIDCRYPVVVTKTLDYDKEKAKNIMEYLADVAELNSNQVEAAMVTAQVDYEIPYNLRDTIEEITEKLALKGAAYAAAIGM